MGETGKRSRHDRDSSNNEENRHKKRPSKKDDSPDEQTIIYRMLCPNDVIGGVIGKGGKVINTLRRETNARIKVVDQFPGADKRVIIIYCYVHSKKDFDVDDEDMEPLCPAQDALFKVHSAIVNAVGSFKREKKSGEEAHLLVPSSQAAILIGKSGATIQRLRSNTKATIKVIPKDPSDATHSCAMSFDSFVQIAGDAAAVKKALFAVSTLLYSFSPKEEISLDTSVPEVPPIIIPSDVPIYHAGSFFSGADAFAPRTVPSIVGGAAQVRDMLGYADTASAWPMYTSALPVVSGFGGPSTSEELIVRVLCPSDKIGRVIGKRGSTLNNMRQDSGARIDVDDKHATDECVITVTSTESTEDDKSASVEAVLLLQTKINDEDAEIVKMRLLVPMKVIGCIIGKNGAIVNDMRKKTNADIRISKGVKPKCAGSQDELVEVSGKVRNVRDALLQIVLRLREDALSDRDGSRKDPPSVDSLYSSEMHAPSIPPVAPLGYDQRVDAERGRGMLSDSSLYGYSPIQTGANGYGSLDSYSSKGYGSLDSYSSKGYRGLPSYIEMVIPGNALGKVMGRGGTNIDNIEKISGAHVEIVESKISRSERIAQISGTAEQKRAAENLIQAFIMST